MLLYPENLPAETEFEFILKLISAHSVTRKGKERILRLIPSSDFHTYQNELILVSEFLSVYQSESSFPAMAYDELNEEWALLKVKNSVMSVEQILNVKVLVQVFNRLHGYFEKQVLLRESMQVFQGLIANPDLIREIEEVIDRHGQVKSTASRELARIRESIDKKRQAADRIFYRILKKYDKQNILAEFGESVVEDKRVLAVNSSFKGQVHGAILGSSAKKSLVFVEPVECMDVNNELATLKEEERKEIRRILKKLTSYLSAEYRFIRSAEEIVSEIDFKHSKALYALETESVLPELSIEPGTLIREGLNPVLLYYNKERKKEVVPLDLELNHRQRIIVISGPNAGGKSISLKTTVLFQAMIQSGILIPAHPKSRIGRFEKVMVDIGDAQSIENELSTYSSKLEKMRHFLEYAGPESLVLIDEFGSGSDPELGSSLAQVFLEKLCQYGAYGVVTTHYNAIKALASHLDGVENGSMRFNKNSFQPEFTLQTGIPGSSYTFEVARKSGIPESLVDEARHKLSEVTLEMDQLLVKVQDEKNALDHARKKLYKKVRELEGLKKKHGEKITVLEGKLTRISESNETNSDYLMWGKRFEGLVNSWIKDSSQKNKKAIISRFIKILKERSGEAKRQLESEKKAEKIRKNVHLQKLLKEEVQEGDRVKLLANHKIGTIREIRKNKYLILLGANITTLLTREQFVKAGTKKKDKK